MSYWWATDPKWETLIKNIDVSGPIIINPRSGFGDKVEPDFVNLVRRIRGHNKPMVGYVRTIKGTRSKESILAEIDKYQKAYKLDGVFLDEMVNGWSPEEAKKMPFYKDLYREIKRRYGNGFLVVGNPGTNTRPEMLEAADMLMSFEKNVNEYMNDKNVPVTTDAYRRQSPIRFIHVAHNANERLADQMLAKASRENVSFIYVTDDTFSGVPGSESPSNNPYDQLPSRALQERTLRWIRGQQQAKSPIKPKPGRRLIGKFGAATAGNNGVAMVAGAQGRGDNRQAIIGPKAKRGNPMATADGAAAPAANAKAAATPGNSPLANNPALANPAAKANAAAAPAEKNVNGKYFSEQEKTTMLVQMGRSNSNAVVKAWHGEKGALSSFGKAGQVLGGVVVMGNKFTMNDAQLIASYDKAFTAGNPKVRRNEVFKYINQWGVIAELHGNEAKDPKVQFRNMTTYILRKGSNTWEKVQVANNINGAEYLYGDMNTSLSSGNGWKEKGLSGAWFGKKPLLSSANGVITLGTVTHQHPYPLTRYTVGNHYNMEHIGKDNIDGVLVTTEVRLAPGTKGFARMALQLGADFKPSDRGNAYDKMAWYPGFGMSRFEFIGREWTRVSAVNVSDAGGGIDGGKGNAISRERFMNSNIPR